MTKAAVNRNPDSLARFVRDELGCACPPEVLRRIETEAAPASFESIGGRWLIRVGGRLMVLLCRPGSLAQLTARLPEIVNTGAELRDREGFRRFRLVVETQHKTESNRRALEAAFQTVAAEDERLHLHVVETGRLPDVLR